MGATPCGSIPLLSAQKEKLNLKYYIIYKTTNIVNGKIYIGKHITRDLNDNYLGSGTVLKAALKKYGLENFKKEILFILDSEEDMNLKEREIVNFDFCLREDNYNINLGGGGGFESLNKIYWDNEKRKIHCSKISPFNKYDSLADEIKEKIKKGKILGGINRRKAGYKPTNKPSMLGKKHTMDSRNKMSLAHSGENNSQYGLKWITNGKVNKKIHKLDPIPSGWTYRRINGNVKIQK